MREKCSSLRVIYQPLSSTSNRMGSTMVFSLIFSMLAFCVGVYFWRQSSVLQKQLREFNTELSSRKNIQAELTTKMSSIVEDLQKKEKEIQEMKRAVLSYEEKWKNTKEENLRLGKALEERNQSLENQVDHYRTQTEVLLTQIKELDFENVQLRKEQEKSLKEIATEKREANQIHQEESKKIRSSHARLESQVQALQTSLSEVQVREQKLIQLLQKIRRRVHQSDHLYKTIRGQKEMLEERNENWEKALRLLSFWILSDKKLTVDASINLGELVSKALVATQQGPLLCDDVDIQIPASPVVQAVEGAVSV